MRDGRALVLVAVALVLGACGGGGEVQVSDVWARSSAGVQNAGAVYMVIDAGDTTDRLVGVAVGSEVAAMAQLHESSMDDAGAMSMSRVEAIDLPSGASVQLAPGGLHIMLMELAEPLSAGAEFELELLFENAGSMVVVVEVREE